MCFGRYVFYLRGLRIDVYLLKSTSSQMVSPLFLWKSNSAALHNEPQLVFHVSQKYCYGLILALRMCSALNT